MRAKRARGYRLHISINSSGLVCLEASGGLGSSVTAVSWQHEWKNGGREKIVKRKEWETDFALPAVSTKGCGSDNISQNETMVILHILTAAFLFVIILNAPCS